MTSKEATALKETLNLMFDWTRNRRPGRAVLAWGHSTKEFPLVFEVMFPEVALTETENEFLPDAGRMFSMDGSTPTSLQPLDQARFRLESIGARLALSKADGKGLALEIAIPAADDADAKQKLDFMMAEMKHQIGRDTAN